jgi:hypothetical protein
MCSLPLRGERLPPLPVLLFLPLFAATACGLGSNDDGRGASLLNGMDPDAGTDPAEDGGGNPGDDASLPPCDPPPPPVDECSAYGGICILIDPNDPNGGMWGGCPPGLSELPFACGEDPALRGVCCGQNVEPPPPVDCWSAGGFCQPLDPSGQLGCPDGTQATMDSCEDGSGLPQICCGRPDEPPPPEPFCYELGGFCAYPDEMGSIQCPDGTTARPDPSCGADPSTPGEGFCCYQDQPPPPPVDDCSLIGGICLPFEPGDPNDPMGFFGCPDGLQPLNANCEDPAGQGLICCGRIDEPPPPPICPEANDPNVFYVSTDPQICAAISYTCPSNHVVFDSECGCGCIGY